MNYLPNEPLPIPGRSSGKVFAENPALKNASSTQTCSVPGRIAPAEVVSSQVTAQDSIDHPQHYTQVSLEPISVIERWQLGFHLGNVVKYIARWPYKGGLEDLKKARWYLDAFIKLQEGEDL